MGEHATSSYTLPKIYFDSKLFEIHRGLHLADAAVRLDDLVRPRRADADVLPPISFVLIDAIASPGA